ncbi:MAG: hypothetical protein H7839_21600 [Magnetococcus sp. YQC-5]
MTQAATFENVWKMFQEMTREDLKRWERLDLQLQENARQIKDTDQKLKAVSKLVENLGESLEDTNRQIKETSKTVENLGESLEDTNRQIKETSKSVGNLSGRWGNFVEGLVAPACETLFAQRGIPVHKVSRQMKVTLPDGRRREIDVFVENTETVALVEVKSALTVEHIREHMTRLVECKVIFPNKRIIGAVAGIAIDETADLFAMRNGLFVIVQAGDQVRLANDETFVPREW